MKAICLSFLIAFVAASASTANAQTQQGGSSAPASSSGSQTSSGGASTQSGDASSPELMGVGSYLLGPGDVVEIRVFRYQQFDGQFDVNSNGEIEIALIDEPIVARCRSTQEVQRDVATALKKYIRNPQVSVRIKERRSRPNAVVSGAVRNPSQFQMLRRVRLLQLLAYTGGITEQAAGTIQIFHTEDEMCNESGAPAQATQAQLQAAATDNALLMPFNTYSVDDLRLGKEEANPWVRPGDVVLVQEAKPIYVTGAVVAPQGVYLRDNLTLTGAIARVGGIRSEANQRKVIIYRRKPGSESPEIITVNYEQIRKNKAPDVQLQAFDIVDVQTAGPFSPGQLKKTLLSFATSGLSTTITSLPVRVLY